MIKIDKVEQLVDITEYEGALTTSPQEDYQFIKLDCDNKKAVIRTNVGKANHEYGLNYGASIPQVRTFNKLQLQTLKLKLIKNNSIEFCIDVTSKYRIYEFDNEKLFNAFRNAGRKLGILVPNRGRNRVDDDIVDNGICYRDIQLSQTMGKEVTYKFYDKSRQWIQKNKVDIGYQVYRFEVKFNSSMLNTKGFKDNSFKLKARAFLEQWKFELGKVSKSNKKERDLIDSFLKELI